eukprot:SAG11_NODE_629_length_8073_cov_6.782042_7_plen_115_part_00
MLVKAFNDKRIEDPSVAKHNEIHRLEVMLGLLNRGQGLGFVVAGTVLNKSFGLGFVAKVSGLGASAISYVLALSNKHDAARAGCSLTKAEHLAFQSMVVTFDTSCTYNITAGPK